jgi:hypothetical protein
MVNQAVRVPEPSVESSASGVHWGAITAGALGAVGITFVLVSLGPALGHVTVSPWSPSGSAPKAFGIAAGIWLIVTQWLASGLGGYLPVACGEVGRDSYGRGTVPRHRAWISRLGFSNLNRRDASYPWIINSGRCGARDDWRFGFFRGRRSCPKGGSCVRIL